MCTVVNASSTTVIEVTNVQYNGDSVIVVGTVSGNSNNTMSFAYDGLNRVTSYTDRLGNTQNAAYKSLSTEYSFTPAGSSIAENNYVENFDIYGNKISETVYPDGLGGDSLTSTYEYDLLGNVLKITDANGKITSMTYDEVNNPTEIVLADGSNVSYDYTKWNSVKTTTQYDGEQSYTISETFDDRGLATSHRQTGVEIKTKPWYYSYRTDGLISMSVAPDGTERSYEYDASGNTTGYSVGAISDEMVYDHFGNLDKITRRVNGTETGATDYVYDSVKGWLNSKTTDLGTTSYTYNTTGMLASVTSPSGLVRNYTRDANDRITSVSADDKDFTYTYYGDGLIKSITYPGGNIVTSYTYDNANRLTKLETKNGNTVLKTYSYEYDGVGNIISVSGSENAEYTYDDLYRLATSTQNGHTTTYEYDSRNNLISETRTDGYTKTYEYSGDNRLVKTVENGVETAYEYDLRGNLVKRGEDEFAYNSNDNLVYANVNGVETTYEIGEDGLRKSKTVNGVTTTYSIDESGNVITEGNDEIILGNVPLAKKIGDNYYYYIYNAHGDVVMIVDESGNVQNTYEYDAWGVVTNQTETINNSHKYAGEYYDTETGLIYLRARYYDPSDRRFTQEDPARDERNWYAYCAGNPVAFVDPWGLSMYTGSEAEASALIDMLQSTTGYNGYGYQLCDGRYLIYDNGTGEINGGSNTARGMVDLMMNPNVDITFTFDNNVNPHTKLYSNGRLVSPSEINLNTNYDQRTATVNLRYNDVNGLHNMYHESDHALTFVYKHYSAILISDNYYELANNGKDIYERQTETQIQNDIVNKYMEASAITVANQVSVDLGMDYRESYYRTGYYANGEWNESGKTVYGSFPFEYTNGNAAILSSLGTLKPVYYSMGG